MYVWGSSVCPLLRGLKISSMVKLNGGKWSVCFREVVGFSEGLLLDFTVDNSVTHFAGRDTTPDAQKEEMEVTNENELYEVPTSCDSQKGEMNIEETHLYEVPIPVIKIAERDTQKKKVNIEMKENVSYEAPTPENMTEVQAFGSLPNKP